MSGIAIAVAQTHRVQREFSSPIPELAIHFAECIGYDGLVRMCCENIRRILGAKDFSEKDSLGLGLLLDPKITSVEMPNLTKTPPLFYILSAAVASEYTLGCNAQPISAARACIPRACAIPDPMPDSSASPELSAIVY